MGVEDVPCKQKLQEWMRQIPKQIQILRQILTQWKLTMQNTLQEWAITSQKWTETCAMNQISQQTAKRKNTNNRMMKYPLKMKLRRTYT